MKRFVGVFSILFTFCLHAQITENFTDSNFTSNPVWNGTTELFVVDDGQLKLFYDTEQISSSQAYLNTKSEVSMKATWQLQATINTTTSSANYVRFYLTSDIEDFTGLLNGYFVMIGNTSDEICLYKQNGSVKTKIIDGIDKRVDFQQFVVSVRVDRDSIGNWKLYSKVNNESDFTLEGVAFDDEVLGSQYAGIFINYSKTNVGKFLFDNIVVEGEKFEDKVLPKILNYEITDSDKLKINFSEEIKLTDFNIVLNDNGLKKVDVQNLSEMEITFFNPLQKGLLHEIKLCGISDKNNNCLADSIFSIYVPNRKDIVFNEIFADSEPQVSLPQAKFIELYNRSEYDIRLKNWLLNIGKSSYLMLDVTLPKNDYLLICSANDTSIFKDYGKIAFVSSLSSMTISSSLLSLYATTGQCVDWVEYTNNWYDSELKKDGGWSLERIDTENFSCINNWGASIDKIGGTPARKNSIAGEFLDTIQPAVEFVSIDAPNTIRIRFSKEMCEETCLEFENYVFNDIQLKDIQIEQPDNRVVTLVLLDELSDFEVDTLIIQNLKDISGIFLPTKILPIVLPQKPENYHDIVINEILFNPKDDGVDYVEILNLTNKTFNLSDIFITTRKDGVLQKRTAITLENELFYANNLLVVSPNSNKVREQYVTLLNTFFKDMDLPNLPDEEGNVVLINKEGFVFDELAYTKKMHHVFIKDSEGVALERVNPNLPTQDNETWQSAASNVGYGTPGRMNSQYIDLNSQGNNDKMFTLTTSTFSPDNDGYQDLLQINYQMPENGYVVSIEIFTINGYSIKKLQNNSILGLSGTFFWNGTDETDTLCNVGVYVIYVEFLHPSGKRGSEKLICSLTSM